MPERELEPGAEVAAMMTEQDVLTILERRRELLVAKRKLEVELEDLMLETFSRIDEEGPEYLTVCLEESIGRPWLNWTRVRIEIDKRV